MSFSCCFFFILCVNKWLNSFWDSNRKSSVSHSYAGCWNRQYVVQITNLWEQQRKRLICYNISPQLHRHKLRVCWMELNTDAHAWFVTSVNSSNYNLKSLIFINSPLSGIYVSLLYPWCSLLLISCPIFLFYLCFSFETPPHHPSPSFLPSKLDVDPHLWQHLSELT